MARRQPPRSNQSPQDVTNTLEVDGLARRFSGAASPALGGVSFSCGAGDTVLLAGPSGSGKSTLLNILGGLDRADGGTVRFRGRSITALGEGALAQYRAREVGIVFQHHLLPPGLLAREAVAAPLLWARGLSPAVALAAADDLLRRLGLDAAECRRPVQNLSGGQRQRVAFARAIAPEPTMLLADEPTAQLDDESAARVVELLTAWAAEEGRILIIASHHPLPGLPAPAQTIRLKDGKRES